MHGQEGNTKCVLVDFNGSVHVVDIVQCKVISTVKIKDLLYDVSDIALTLDNKRIFLTGQRNTTDLFEVDVARMSEQSNEEVHPSIKRHKTNHTRNGWLRVQVTSDGKYLMTTNKKESIFWDLKTIKPIMEGGIRFTGLYGPNRLCRGVI